MPLELYIVGHFGTHESGLVSALSLLFSRSHSKQAASVRANSHPARQTDIAEILDLFRRGMGLCNVACPVAGSGVNAGHYIRSQTGLASRMDWNSHLGLRRVFVWVSDVFLDGKKDEKEFSLSMKSG